MKSFQESCDGKAIRTIGSPDTSSSNFFSKLPDRNNRATTFPWKENYRELIPQVGWDEGVQILRIVDTFYRWLKNKDRRNEFAEVTELIVKLWKTGF